MVRVCGAGWRTGGRPYCEGVMIPYTGVGLDRGTDRREDAGWVAGLVAGGRGRGLGGGGGGGGVGVVARSVCGGGGSGGACRGSGRGRGCGGAGSAGVARGERWGAGVRG